MTTTEPNEPTPSGPAGEPSFEEAEDALLRGDRAFTPGSARAAWADRTFRTVFLGAFASNIGTWMQNVVLGAFVTHLANEGVFTEFKPETLVGFLAFAQLGPLLLFSLLGGAIADAFDRKTVLIVVSIEQIAFSLLLTFAVLPAKPNFTVMWLLVLAIGIGQAVYAPTFTAMLPGLAGRENLSGAIALNSAQMNASRVIGPAIGAVLYSQFGAAWVFGGNALTYLFIIGALLAVTLPDTGFSRKPQRARDLLVGLRVARRDRVVGRCLIIIYVFSFACLPFVTEMPVLATDNLGLATNSVTYGLLYATFGLGAVVGALWIGTAWAKRWGAMLTRAGLASFAVALAAFALVRTVTFAFPVAFFVGFTYFATITSLSTVLQERLDEDVRGRVMALWIMGFGGTVPLGALAAGPLISATSVTAVLLGGAVVAVLLAWFADLRDPVPDPSGTPATA